MFWFLSPWLSSKPTPQEEIDAITASVVSELLAEQAELRVEVDRMNTDLAEAVERRTLQQVEVWLRQQSNDVPTTGEMMANALRFAIMSGDFDQIKEKIND